MRYADFCSLWARHAPSQEKMEYYLFLQFVESYFEMQRVTRPVVVEIGVRGIAQAGFYTKLLNAEYIGMDIVDKHTPQVIFGDSHDPKTKVELEKRLNGRGIDLLFIDGWHSYDSARKDWDMYSPLAKHLVGIHDINWVMNYFEGQPDHSVREDSVHRLWSELYDEGKSMISFQCPGSFTVSGTKGTPRFMGDPGIGVVLMDRTELEQRWSFDEKKFKAMWGENAEAYPRCKPLPE